MVGMVVGGVVTWPHPAPQVQFSLPLPPPPWVLVLVGDRQWAMGNGQWMLVAHVLNQPLADHSPDTPPQALGVAWVILPSRQQVRYAAHVLHFGQRHRCLQTP